MSEIQFKIDGTDRVSLLFGESIDIDMKLNGTSKSTATIHDHYTGFEPKVGHEVEVIDTNGNLVFGGEIDSIEIEDRDNVEGEVFYGLEMVDWEEICSRRVVDLEFSQKTHGEIVRTIVDDVLSSENISKGTIKEGDNVIEKDFSMVKVRNALDELARMSGFQWWITPDKVLNFQTLGGGRILPTLTGSARDISVEKNRSDYRNRQIIIGDGQQSGHTQEVTEKITVTSDNNTVQTKHPIQDLVSIDPGGVGKNLPMYRNLDMSDPVDQALSEFKVREWRFEEGSRYLTRSSTFSEGLDPGEVVTVTYEAQADVMVIVDDPDRQSERQAIEQGTGIHTSIERVDSINTKETARAYGKGLIQQHGSIDPVVNYRTDTNNPLPGEAKPINIPKHKVTERVGVVQRVKVQDVGRHDKIIERLVTVDTAPIAEGWERYYQQLAESDRTGLSNRESSKYATSGVAGSGGFGGSYQTDPSMENKDNFRGIDGGFVWGAKGTSIERIGLDKKVKGELNIGSATVTVGNGKMIIGDDPFDVITDPVNEEGGGVSIDENYSLSSGLSFENIAYAKSISSNFRGDRDFLWGLIGKNIYLIDLQNEAIVRDWEISGNSTKGLDEDRGQVWIPKHNNFDPAFNVGAYDTLGNSTGGFKVAKDRELSQACCIVKGMEQWIQKSSPSELMAVDFEGNIVENSFLGSYNDLAFGVA